MKKTLITLVFLAAGSIASALTDDELALAGFDTSDPKIWKVNIFPELELLKYTITEDEDLPSKLIFNVFLTEQYILENQGSISLDMCGIKPRNDTDYILLTGKFNFGGQTGPTNEVNFFLDGNTPISPMEDSTVQFTYNQFASEYIICSVSANFAVPEPTTATMSLLALAGLAARRRRK